MMEMVCGEHHDEEYPALEVQTHEIVDWDQDTTIDEILVYQSERSHRPHQRPQGNRPPEKQSNGFQQGPQGNRNQENQSNRFQQERKPRVFMDNETWTDLSPNGKKGMAHCSRILHEKDFHERISL